MSYRSHKRCLRSGGVYIPRIPLFIPQTAQGLIYRPFFFTVRDRILDFSAWTQVSS